MQTHAGRLPRPFGGLYYEVTGSGPPIVFAHGLGGSHLSWWQQVAHFAPRHACVTFSHRGFSPSDAVPGGPDPADYAGDLAALIAHLALERPLLVAQSMGGWTCLDYALAHRGAVAGLVMACTTGTLDFAGQGGASPQDLAAWRDRAARTLPVWREAGIHPGCGEGFARRSPDLYQLYQAFDRLNAGLDKDAVRRLLHAARKRAPADLGALDCPVLFIAGEDDLVMPACGLEAVSRHAARGAFVTVPDAGHSVYFEHAARFNVELDGFIATLESNLSA